MTPASLARLTVLLPRPELGVAGIQALSRLSHFAQSPPTPRLAATRLYETHVPLNPLQKLAVAVLGSAGAALNPARADLVAAVGETTGSWAAAGMLRRIQASEEGQLLLAERPRVTDATLHACRGMAEGTFGFEYARFMGDRGFAAGERPPVRFMDDGELAYVMTRSREVHDFWHVLFDCHTNVFGELALKALEFVQTGLPMTAMAVVGAQWRLSARDRHLLNSLYLPWAVRAGTRCSDLIAIYYERHFEEDLVTLRQRWGITPAPLPPAHLRMKAPAGAAAAGAGATTGADGVEGRGGGSHSSSSSSGGGSNSATATAAAGAGATSGADDVEGRGGGSHSSSSSRGGSKGATATAAAGQYMSHNGSS